MGQGQLEFWAILGWSTAWSLFVGTCRGCDFPLSPRYLLIIYPCHRGFHRYPWIDISYINWYPHTLVVNLKASVSIPSIPFLQKIWPWHGLPEELNKRLKEHMNKAGACLYAEVGRGQKGGAAFRTREEVPRFRTGDADRRDGYAAKCHDLGVSSSSWGYPKIDGFC